MLLLVVCLMQLTTVSWFSSELRVQCSQGGIAGEVQVLLDFKSRLNDSSAAELADWSAANGHNLCLNWTGIHCDPSKQHVVSMQLADLSLGGTMTPMLGQLKHLQVLNLSSNAFHGPIPDSLGKLQALQELDLSRNLWKKSIPTSLGNCTRLEFLDLSWNRLSGQIPDTLGQLQMLQKLDLAWNEQLKGSIPASLGNCTRLEFLNLSYNDLSGHIPDTLAQLSMLRELHIYGNGINGSIPEWIRQLHQLEELDLSFNNLEGGIISKLIPASLRSIKLTANNLEGMIPSSLFQNCTLLERIYLGQNNLTGEFPNLSQPLPKLIGLDLAYNHLTGGVPNPALFPNLEEIDLSHNSFSGGIPGNWSGTRLDWMDLSHNHLQGPIPPHICQGQLVGLFLSDNNLSGPLPPSLGNCSSLHDLVLSSNRLEGEIFDMLHQMNWVNVSFLDISENRFRGDISHISVNISQAMYLNLGHNHFTGSIPQELCSNKEELSFLSLASNNLHGNIPSCITDLAYLQILDLSGNNLSGPLPHGLHHVIGFQNESRFVNLGIHYKSGHVEISFLYDEDVGLHRFPEIDGPERLTPEWRKFDLSNNNLEGEIPAALGQLYGIRFLNLSRNNFSGTIPAELGNIKDLLKLDVSHNRLQGPIPASITSLDLSSFSVAYNNLSGPIPIADSFNTRFDNSSFEGNAGLYGCPLTSCAPQPTKPTPPFKQLLSEHEEQKGLFAHFSAWSFFGAALVAFCLTFSITLFSNPLRVRALASFEDLSAPEN